MDTPIKKERSPYEFKQRIHMGFEQNATWLTIKNLDEIDPHKIIVLCCGGAGTVTDKDAIYVAKFAQRLIGIGDEAIVLSMKHTSNKGERSALYYKDKPEAVYADELEEARTIAAKLVIPRVLTEDGEKLPIETAAKNMRNVNIFSHCFGHFSFVKHLEQQLDYYLKAIGYSQAEADHIMKQVFVLSYEAGPFFKTEKFSNFNVSSLGSDIWKDYALDFIDRDLSKVTMPRDDKQEFLKSLMYRIKDKEAVREFFRHSKYAIMLEGNVVDLYVDQITKDGSDHDLESIYRHKGGWEMGYYANETGDTASKGIAVALAMAVVNSMKNNESDHLLPLDMQEIMMGADSVLEDTRRVFGEVQPLDLPQK